MLSTWRIVAHNQLLCHTLVQLSVAFNSIISFLAENFYPVFNVLHGSQYQMTWGIIKLIISFELSKIEAFYLENFSSIQYLRQDCAWSLLSSRILVSNSAAIQPFPDQNASWECLCQLAVADPWFVCSVNSECLPQIDLRAIWPEKWGYSENTTTLIQVEE